MASWLLLAWILDALFGFGSLFLDGINELFKTNFKSIAVYYIIFSVVCEIFNIIELFIQNK